MYRMEVDYELHDIEGSKRKMGSYPTTDKLLVCRRKNPRRCENGYALADTQKCPKTD